VDRSQIAGVSRHFRTDQGGDPTLLRAQRNLRGRNRVDPRHLRGAIRKPVGDKFTLIPPFKADYGLNIGVGRSVFIGYQYMFTGHGIIDIADAVMIANKVHLVTAGHPVEPEKRRAYITEEPITIETNVWIGEQPLRCCPE
jgi:acetyltransferase-like isoleucine patch superfamily enzyme